MTLKCYECEAVRRRPALTFIALFAVLTALAVLPAGGAAAATAVRLSERDKADVSKVGAYLNGIRTLRARFFQFGPRGGVARGTIFISRPGRLRVQYDPPVKVLLVATPIWLIHYDGELDQVSYLPLNSTPAGFLVQKRIRLTGKVHVTAIKRERGRLFVTIAESRNAQKGKLTLIFSQNPLTLREWRVLDPRGLPTRVTLRNTQTGIKLDRKLFQFVKPGPDRFPDR